MTVEDHHAGHPAMCVRCQRTFQVPPKPQSPGVVAQITSFSTQDTSVFGAPPVPATPQSAQAVWLRPHRGGLILGLGIASIVLVFMGCCCCGVLPILTGLVTIVMGGSDLSAMNRGEMDSAGKAMTQTGILLAVIALGVMALIFGVGMLGGGIAPSLAPRGFPQL